MFIRITKEWDLMSVFYVGFQMLRQSNFASHRVTWKSAQFETPQAQPSLRPLVDRRQVCFLVSD